MNEEAGFLNDEGIRFELRIRATWPEDESLFFESACEKEVTCLVNSCMLAMLPWTLVFQWALKNLQAVNPLQIKSPQFKTGQVEW